MNSIQLTSPKTCKQKRTYHRLITAKNAAKRRNKAAGYKYLRHYQCNVCQLWHVTSQVRVTDLDNIGLEATPDSSNPPNSARTNIENL